MGILSQSSKRNIKEERGSQAETKYKGSLTLTLVRTLLLFTILPLALMGVVTYTRTRALLREQFISQSQLVMTSQLKQSAQNIQENEKRLTALVEDAQFSAALESAFHANRQNSSFSEIRRSVLQHFESLNNAEDRPGFDQFFLLGADGTIEIATNPNWEGALITDANVLPALQEEHASILTYTLSPLYPDQPALLTAVQYRTPGGSSLGTVVGVTESNGLKPILQSVKDLRPDAETYFFIPPNHLLRIEPEKNEFVPADISQSQAETIFPAFDQVINQDALKPLSVEYTGGNGNKYLAEIEWMPDLNAGVVLEVDQQMIYGSINSLAPFTAILILLSLAAMGLVIWAGTKRVIQPLQTLTAITQRYAQGDWSQRAPVTSKDEIGWLAESFNNMADRLSSLYESLEQKVDERTRQIRTASEVAQSVTGTTSLEELLNRTVEIIVNQFGFYHAGIFLIDSTGRYAVLRAAYGPTAAILLARGHRLEVGSASIIGWVTSSNLPRIFSDVIEDPIHLKNEFLPETRSEIGVPISVGDRVLGALDVQSKEPNAFAPDTATVILLQTLASQIASAIQNIELIEAAQINVQELERLYRSSHLIAEARSESAAFDLTGKILSESPYPHVMLDVNDDGFSVRSYSGFDISKIKAASAGLKIGSAGMQIARYISSDGLVITAPETMERLGVLASFSHELGCQTAAFLPVERGDQIAALIMLGSTNRILSKTSVQPYTQMSELLSAALEKIASARQTEQHLTEMGALAALSQVVAASSNLESFYTALHEQVKRLIGEYSFTVALYDEKTDTISIPFNYEDGTVSTLESFPLGQGLTSILIHTKQPFMLVEDTERKAREMGAKIVGRPARSWMGAPLLIQNRAIGALIIQDLERDRAFTEDNLRFFTALAGQVAGAIYNVMLLEESQNRTIQLQTAAEIAREVSLLQNLDELLLKAVNLIRDRFTFYHAGVFLLDAAGEYVVIREATGEAGAQLKRNGYKLGVGTKSIIGYVASRGEPLVVNDTANDATFLANPLLPNTRAEAAIPLKVGERILGVLDVQSSVPFAFAEDNLRTLQILADQLAVAVANAELFAETQEHLSQHRLLHHITTASASGSTLEEALESAVNGLQVSLGGDRVSILLADKDKRYLEPKALAGYSDEVGRIRIQIGSGITGWAAAHRRPLRVGDVRNDPRYVQASPNTRSELAVPLVYRNELLGVLNVESEQPNAYSENDEEMLGTLGGSLAAIIANALLLEQIRTQAEREHSLFEITNKIRRSADMETILNTTASELSRVIGARRTQIKIEVKNGDEG